MAESDNGNKRKGNHRKGSTPRKLPLISIITITYNAEDCIAPTVRSVAEQTHTDYEHIIIDGASKDSTIAKARAYGSRHLKILSEPDNGLYDAMNKGLAMARGKYVVFLNAGDTFHSPSTLQHYAEAASANPDIIYGDTVIVDANRKFLRNRHLSVPDILTTHSFRRGMLICHQAFMVRRALAPSYNTEYRFSADYDWCLRCIMKSRPGARRNLHETTIDYLDNGLTEKNKLASLFERFRIMKLHYGLSAAILAHLSFIPRGIIRKIRHAKK